MTKLSSATITPTQIVSRYLTRTQDTPALTPQIELDGAGKIKTVRWLEDWEIDEIWGPSARIPRELCPLSQKRAAPKN